MIVALALTFVAGLVGSALMILLPRRAAVAWGFAAGSLAGITVLSCAAMLGATVR